MEDFQDDSNFGNSGRVQSEFIIGVVARGIQIEVKYTLLAKIFGRFNFRTKVPSENIIVRKFNCPKL